MESEGLDQSSWQLLEYYQELGNIMTDEKKIMQAIDCFKKALHISRGVYGDEHFVTFECLLNLAQLLEENDQKQEAEDLYHKCLASFDKHDTQAASARMMKGHEINDKNGDISFTSSNLST